jgi:hypothetical protein
MTESDSLPTDERLGRLWARYGLNLGKVSNLHEWYKLAAEHTTAPLIQQKRLQLETHPSLYDEERTLASALQAAANVQNNALFISDAAVIVFLHSIIDDFISGLVTLSIDAETSAWKPHISKWCDDHNVTYTLDQLQSKSFPEEFSRRTEDYIRAVSRKSIPNRYRILLGMLEPTREIMARYVFIEQFLVDVDTYRHKLVHDDLLGQPLPMTETFIERAHSLCEFFVTIFIERYNLKPRSINEGLRTMSFITPKHLARFSPRS